METMRNPATRPLVIYHAGCKDGWTAAWIAHNAFEGDCDLVSAHHGHPPPDVAGRDVYVLDFSYKRPVMQDLLASAARVCVLDHHKTAQAELAYLCDGSAEEFRSGR